VAVSSPDSPRGAAVIDPDALAREFEQRFGSAPRLYRAPGRVNLIGEHTDYNDGFAMPMALDQSTWVAAAPRSDRRLAIVSRAYRETFTIDLDNQPRYPTGSWSDYVRGVAATVDANGADLLIDSDVPIGAGLSSSAAVEVACGYALIDLAGRAVDLDLLARAAQRAEHEYVGTRCGLMDQMAACFGRAGHALLLDTRSFDHRLLALPASVRVLVANTMVHHELASSEYNQRRADCEAGVAWLARRFGSVRALRDVTVPQLEDVQCDMPEQIYRRCRHVVTEDARTLAAVDALAGGDFGAFGRLMNASHASLRDDYEVSCAELDTIAAIARACDGVYGARMTGGGFGGSIVALVAAPHADAARERIATEYARATGLEPDIWVCRAGDGAERIDARRAAPAV
jgi:galactokinase